MQSDLQSRRSTAVTACKCFVMKFKRICSTDGVIVTKHVRLSGYCSNVHLCFVCNLQTHNSKENAEA